MEENSEEIVAEQKSEVRRDKFLPISILIASLVIGGSMIFATLYHPNVQTNNVGGNNGGNGGTGSTASLTAAQINTLGPRDAVLGDPNAPVTLIEYGDYQCPFCSRFYSTIQPQIMQQYVSPGKVKMIFRDFAFLGPESITAGEAAECAQDQNKLWAYHDALYQAKENDFTKGGSEDDGFYTRTFFLQLAQNLNFDMPTFTKCIDSHQDSNLLTKANQDAAAAGVVSTPTVFIDGKQLVDANGNSVGADANAILQALATATQGK